MSEVKARASTGRERIEIKERTIVDAARAAFIDKGYQGAKMAEIAKAAGISEGSVYFYYPNKDALMHAVLADFWETLTKGAVQSVDPALDTFEQTEALARYHLNAVIRNFAFIDLQFTLRGTRMALDASREQLRKYVAVLDRIIHSGVDRGVIKPDVEIWLLRDMFYGTLEYAARTLTGRARPKREEIDRVVRHLVSHLFALHGAAQPPQLPSHDKALDRLQTIADQMAAALSASANAGSNATKKARGNRRLK